MKYYTKIENGLVVAYRTLADHGEVLCDEVIKNGGIIVDEELRQHCLRLGIVSFVGKIESRVYTINDKNLFKVENLDVVIEKLNISKDELNKEIVHKTQTEIKVEILEKENADLLKDNAMKDIRIDSIENDMADLMKEIALGGM